jgi:hypothetical protein
MESRMRWAGHVASLGKMIHSLEIFTKGNTYVRVIGVTGRIILKWILELKSMKGWGELKGFETLYNDVLL